LFGIVTVGNHLDTPGEDGTILNFGSISAPFGEKSILNIWSLWGHKHKVDITNKNLKK